MATANLALTDLSFVDPASRTDAPAKIWHKIAARRGQALRIGIGVALLAAGATLYAPDSSTRPRPKP